LLLVQLSFHCKTSVYATLHPSILIHITEILHRRGTHRLFYYSTLVWFMHWYLLLRFTNSVRND